jgi:predicted nucleic-acid-binding protein
VRHELPLTAPRLLLEKADVIWRALRAYRDWNTDFSDAVTVELSRDAGCSKTVTFDRHAANDLFFGAIEINFRH